MILINNATLNNFRGINNTKFNFNSINLFIGRNNTGKSSILESLALFLTSFNDFSDSKEENLVRYLKIKKRQDLSYLVSINEKKAELIFNLNGVEYLLTIENYKSGLPDDERTERILKIIYAEAWSASKYDFYNYQRIIPHRRTIYRDSIFNKRSKIYEEIIHYETKIGHLKKEIENLKQIKIYDTQERIENARNELSEKEKEKKEIESMLNKLREENVKIIVNEYIESEKTIISIYKEKNKLLNLYTTQSDGDILPIIYGETDQIPPVAFDFDVERPTTKASLLYEKITNNKVLTKNAIKNLTDNIEYLEDIRGTEKNLKVAIKDLEETLPIEVMGKGFVSLVELIFLISFAQNGVILLEEPEVSLHPGFMKILAESLIKGSSNAQLFISTHSLDLVNNLLETAEMENKLRDIQVITMQRIKDSRQIKIDSIPGTDALSLMNEIGIDLREY